MNKNISLEKLRGEQIEEEPVDRTKYIWMGIIILILVMLISFWAGRSPRPVTTSVRAKHILISFDPADPVERGRAYEHAQELRERILAGESFERIARNHSDDTVSARRGGDLGWAPRETYATPVEQYVWHAEPGQVSDVIQTQFGFHLVVVEDRHIAGADLYELELERRAFDELREQEAQDTQGR